MEEVTDEAPTPAGTVVNKGLLADVYPSTVDGAARHKLFGWQFDPGMLLW